MKNGEVDEKLCCIEQAKLDALCKFLAERKEDIAL